MELYRHARPTDLDGVVGQDTAVSTLRKHLEQKTLPHVLLFLGPSGVGKTTLAKILASQLDCTGMNLLEINCADFRGIDTVREIREAVPLSPWGGKYKSWLLDEVVQLPRTTQQAFLHLLENVPEHVYFFLTSTTTEGLLPTFLSRCAVVQLQSLSPSDLIRILSEVSTQHLPSARVINTIADSASGNARVAIQLLEAALAHKKEEDQLAAVQASSIQEEEAVEFLGKALLWDGKGKASWSKIAAAIKAIPDSEVEKYRRRLLAYACAILLSKPSGRAAQMIRVFEDPQFGGGKASFAANCYEMYSSN